jgi:hypothetical protein
MRPTLGVDQVWPSSAKSLPAAPFSMRHSSCGFSGSVMSSA